ncbi:hypothetical protein M1563_03005 [Patescibacteria group bacterium]|nr:hypothetical protein [Patescibacteria group bacterium]
MDKDEQQSIALGKYQLLYQTLLGLYPRQYQNRFGSEMLEVFTELYQEEIDKHGSAGIYFWFAIWGDLLKSVLTQHWELMQKQGMKKYLKSTFNINIYNVTGGLLILPFMVMLGLDLVSRLIQGDLTHYNRSYYQLLSQTFLMQGPAQLFWVIIFPLAALIINLIPFFKTAYTQQNRLAIKSLVLTNLLAVAIMSVGLFALLLAFGHDYIPCFFHHLFLDGLDQIAKTALFCRSA